MTIAACYVSPEGIVLGADSTASFNFGAMHYYNHNQKLFELGDGSTLGIVTWGLGSLTCVPAGGERQGLTFDNILDHRPTEPAPWVRDMQQHYAVHGYFRATALASLLGAPGESVSGASIIDFVRNGIAKK